MTPRLEWVTAPFVYAGQRGVVVALVLFVGLIAVQVVTMVAAIQ